MLVAAAALPLAACGIRFESDAPSFLPTPSPDPAGPAILAERTRVARAVSALAAAPSGPRTQLRPVHTAQLAALDTALASLDPPLDPPLAPPADAPGPSGTPRPTATPVPAARALARLAEAEGAALDGAGLTELDRLLPRAATVVVTSHAQRAVLLELVAAAGTRVPQPARLPWHAATPELALGIVGDLRSAAYGLEVGAAHLDPARRSTVLACLEVLRDAETHLGALVDDLPPRPLGYRLPRPVRTPQEALALTTGVLDRLVEAVLAAAVPSAVARRDAAAQGGEDAAGSSGTSGPSGTSDAAGTSGAGATTTPSVGQDAATLVRLTRIAELTRLRCGGTLRPLPGLRAPAPTGGATTAPAGSSAPPATMRG